MIDIKKTLAKAVKFEDDIKKAEKSKVLKLSNVVTRKAIQIPDFSR